jgi:alpha-mannosidase
MNYPKKLLAAIFFSFIFLLNFQAFAQVEVPVFGKQQLINGYAKTISGENIPYFSVYPDYAKEALLTRATDGKKAIKWETSPIPNDTKGDYAYFSWIAAHSTGTNSGNRNFDVYINDAYVLTFTTYPKNYPPYWAFGGKDSTKLVFELVKKDGAADAHGFAYLRVPLSKYKKGEPLRIKVIGQNQNSNDWYMTFKYSFEEKIDAEALPFLLKGKTPMQALTITVLHFGAPQKMTVTANGHINKQFWVKNGINSFDLPIPAYTKPGSATVYAKLGDLVVNKTIPVKPVIHRDIYLVHNSHNDIGYSNTQEEVEQIQDKNIRDALHLIDKTKNYPEGSRFVWNVESLWAVENFLNSCTPAEKARFIADVRDRRIGLSAMYANILSGLCTPEEMNWIVLYADSLRKTYHVPINTAMMTDIPGLSWSMVHALASNGVHYFSNGPNYVQGMADMGDRIGYTLKALGDKPFWWKSSSGNDSILFWTAGKGYSSWHGTPIGGVFDRGPKKIANYMNELDEKKYPYSIVQWRYNIVSDNGPVDSTISDFVRQWNEKYESPRLILSNVADVFTALEKKYGKVIPVFSGDFTPYWEDGAYSTAREEAENRLLSEKILQLENISKQQNKNINPHWLYEAKRDVVMFHEHTWGAYNSISEPDAPFVIHQWNYKKRFVDSAKYYTDKIEAALFPQTDNPSALIVYNSLGWSRTSYVEMDWPSALTGNTLVDEKGNFVPVQKLASGKMVFMTDVPAAGKASYRFGPMVKRAPVKADYIAYTTNTNTGAINYLSALGRNWVDTGKYALGEAIYVKGLDPANHFFTVAKKERLLDSGNIVKQEKVNCTLEGTNSVNYVITQFNGTNDLQIAVTIDKKAIRDKEAIHIALPFLIENPEVKIGMDNSYITPEKGQIPGSNKDFYSVQRWLDVSNKDYGVTISSPEGALFEVGDMVDEREVNEGTKLWKKENHSSATIFLYAMNNYWHTNSKADQDGKVTFNIYLHFHKQFDLKEAQRFGEEMSEPGLRVMWSKMVGSINR